MWAIENVNINEPTREENNIIFEHAEIQHTHKSLLENYLQLSKSTFFKSVLLKLTKNLFTSF